MASVTCVIPTALRGNAPDSCLHSVLHSAQRHRDAEVLLVVNNTTARPPAALTRRYPGLRVLYCDQAGPAAARNLGLDQAASDTVVFTDDDCTVPDTWLENMAAVLRRPGVGAVAGPVGVKVGGAVTAFLDYQRVFDAPAVDGEHVSSVNTASCGIRRDRVALRFDAATFAHAGGEDTEFGYRLSEAGHRIAWCGEVEVKQVFAEDVSEITERFMRYGRASAQLFLCCGRWQESFPGAIDWYRDFSAGRADYVRRFSEITDDLTRLLFSTYEVFLTVSWLIGYLGQAGEQLGAHLIAADEIAVRRELSLIAAGLAAGRAVNTPASGPDVDLSRIGHPVLEGSAPPLAQVGAVLREHAPLAPAPPSAVRALDEWAPRFSADEAVTVTRVERQWRDLTAGQAALDRAALNASLRSVGASFKDGCDAIEQLVQRSAKTAGG